MHPRILDIGDVHGCDAVLEALLAVLKVQPEDTLVFLGDLMDHGPGSKEVMAKLIELEGQCKVIYVMGNHEELMRDAISGRGSFEMWERVGGKATMESYGGSVEAISPGHIRALLSAQPFWETDTEIYVHAAVEPMCRSPIKLATGFAGNTSAVPSGRIVAANGSSAAKRRNTMDIRLLLPDGFVSTRSATAANFSVASMSDPMLSTRLHNRESCDIFP